MVDHWPISQASRMTQQQERLVLLHHARKCPHDENEGGVCPVSPHCAGTKLIWKHIAECKSKKCSHCYSWRYILTHYRECKDGKCPICGPVREVIRRGKEEKQRQLQRQAVKADTFSTSMTTCPTTGTSGVTMMGHPSPGSRRDLFTTGQPACQPVKGTICNTIDEWVARNNGTAPVAPAISPAASPTLTVAICRSADNVGRIIPVHRRRPSFGSMSTISQSSGAFSLRSSAPSSRSSGCSYSGRCTHPNCGGIKCRENPGIAHFGNGGSRT
mmetsp:Transcript_33019/g.79889  ORF Transcript_33019/g.79889 Transcript_33019/m.79889 type:complete len:272 (+) Transcript_33019:160-975(+)